MRLGTAGRAVSQDPTISHDPLRCLAREDYPVVDARIEPGPEVRTAKVYFRAEQFEDFYYVEMQIPVGGRSDHVDDRGPQPHAVKGVEGRNVVEALLITEPRGETIWKFDFLERRALRSRKPARRARPGSRFDGAHPRLPFELGGRAGSVLVRAHALTKHLD